jgi:hypothetical protein
MRLGDELVTQISTLNIPRVVLVKVTCIVTKAISQSHRGLKLSLSDNQFMTIMNSMLLKMSEYL